jgi:hypothetical protein
MLYGFSLPAYANLLKPKIYLNETRKFSSYLAESATRPHYKDKSSNAAWGNDGRLF